jgi:hypothetical protein
VLAVCLLDPCSRHSKYRFMSVKNPTTTRHPCQDQGMCFARFLRPPVVSHRRTRHPCPAGLSHQTTSGRRCLPSRPSPSAAQPDKSITPIIRCQIRDAIFIHHTAAAPGPFESPRGDLPFAAQRGPNLPHLSGGVKSDVRTLKSAATWTCAPLARGQASLRQCIPDPPQRAGREPGASHGFPTAGAAGEYTPPCSHLPGSDL